MKPVRSHAQNTRRRRRTWLTAFAAIFLAIAGGLLWTALSRRDSRTADERLAEIEAARAVPDSENAAIIYNQLLQNPNATSILNDFPESPTGDVLGRVLREPWRDEDLPEVAAWVKKRQSVIDRLLEASRLEKCRFAISVDITDTSEVDRAAPLRQWGYLLGLVANNDLADGRIDAAMVKWRCLLRMASQLHQQPTQIDHLMASALGRQALEPMARFIMAGDASEPRLQEIEAMELPTKDDWPEQRKATRMVEDVRSRKIMERFGPLGRLRYHVMSFRMQRAIKSATGEVVNQATIEAKTADPYFRSIATARGIRILVALKRHRNVTGRWPETLDEIKPSLSNEILTDPFNKGPFVYRPASDGFRLYSRGRNSKDEGGKRDLDAGPDDWPIWPPHGYTEKDKQVDGHKSDR